MKNVMRAFWIVLFTGVLAASGFDAKAQQDPQFSFNVFNTLYFNPAYAGMNDGVCAYMLGRQQWVGFEGRPETYVFGAHGTFTIPGINLRSGGGLNIMGDGLGQMHFFNLKAMYSAHIPLTLIGSDPGHLGIGVSAGLLQFSIGNNWRSVDDYFIDPIIPDEGFAANQFDLGAGIYYQTSKLYLGLSSSHLNAPSFTGNGSDFYDLFPNVAKQWNSTFQMTRHYYLVAGYALELPNPMFVLKPSLFMKSEISSAQIDLNCLVEWNHFLWGGLTYRYTDAIVAMGGVVYDGFGFGTARAGYSYDITTSRLNQGSNGSHEIFVQYCFQLKKPPSVYEHRDTRFM